MQYKKVKPEMPDEFHDAVIRFGQCNRQSLHNVGERVKTHPLMVKTLFGAGAVVTLMQPVLASVTVEAEPTKASASFGMDGAQIDSMFNILNVHILPDVGQTIAQLPTVIIPIVILIVLIVILMFVPELLYSLLDMLKGAFKMKR